MIIFDLDGTLANCEHRRHFVDPSKNPDLEAILPPCMEINALTKPKWVYKNNNRKIWKPDWEAFYNACDKDEPIHETRYLLEELYYAENHIEIWSGRCESVRNKTENWIHRNLGGMKRIKKLLMRPIGDSTPDDILKERWVNERSNEYIGGIEIPNTHGIVMVFDDRPKVVRMWRRKGIFVLNCCQHDEEF